MTKPALSKTASGTTRLTGWMMRGNHVWPVNDLREHRQENCWCDPTADEGVIVHNSLDQRELYERGERKLT